MKVTAARMQIDPSPISNFFKHLHKVGRAGVSVLEVVLVVAAVLALIVLIGVLSWRWAIAALGAVVATFAVIVRVGPDRAASAQAAGNTDQSGAIWQSSDVAAIVDCILDATLLLDSEARVIASNTTARGLFTIVQGRHIAQVVRAPELLAAVERAMVRREVEALQVRLTPPHEQVLAVRISPIRRRERGDAPSLLIVLRDMTEQEQLSRMRADFVANASHELRTPLASLKGFVETLQGAAKDDPKAREQFLGIMQEQASRMSRLIDDLLSLSRIEMREHVPPRDAIDLADVAEGVLATLKPIAETAGIRLQLTATQRPAFVVGDRDELAQVAQNLIQNAIKYGRKGGLVDVKLAPEGHRMALSVRDDGIGIPSEHLPRLTERFYRVSAKDSRERGGTGLGLAIVKHIVSRHRGELRIESAPGQGSTFTVALPRPQT